uniref:Protein kinase domain-containing protein n=2 Tax=Parascaris univalens TaxID=6257 RepID=A0A915CIW3_PARUN
FLKVYVVLDFGMAREYVHADGRIENPRALTGFRGTVKYAPLSCHILRELCRKDDVESWLYMIVEITCGKLPWRNLVEINAVGIYKKNCRKDKGIKRLFGGCPRKYVDILRICDKTKFFDTPDYARIYEIMNECIKDTHSVEYPYDWEKDSTKPDENGGTNVVSEYGAASDYHGQSKMQSAVCINHQQQKSFVKSDPLYK